jgi:hypothetical protein
MSLNDPLGDTSVVGAGGTERVDIDEKANSLEFYGSGGYAISGTNVSVPVQAGQLRSFSNALGTFSARWTRNAAGNVSFNGYRNDKGQTLEEVVNEIQELTSSWKYKLLNFGNSLLGEQQKDPIGFNLKLGVTLLSGSAMAAAEPLPYAPSYNPSVTFSEGSSTAISSSPYAGVRTASKFLIGQGVPRALRLQVLQSFEIETISLKAADDNTFGLRFFDNNNAFEKGRYLFPTFENSINRFGLALPYKWNRMTNFMQFQIRPGSPYIFGRAAAQENLGGGAYQMFVPNLNNLLK